MPSGDPPPRPGASAPGADRGQLDSWKEIAAYLRRDISTVQRWEKQEGLPVHRHLHNKRGSVYAYAAELDAWWTRRRAGLEPPQNRGSSAARARGGLSRSRRVAAALLVVVGALLAQGPGLPYREREWVLVAAFEDLAGEVSLEGAVDHILPDELERSGWRVVPRPRVEQTLRLMRQPPGARVDVVVAREVAVRDGAIHAVLAGRAERLGSASVISLSVFDPDRELAVATHGESTAARQEIPKAVRRLARWAGRALGETLPAFPRRAALEKVTTASPLALRRYTEAMALIRQDQWGAAAPLLAGSVEEDPEFASAHMFLAWALFYTRMSPPDWKAHRLRALELAGKASEPEADFIRGSYHLIAGEHDAATPYFEALLKRRPDDEWARDKLVQCYQGQGRWSDASRIFVALAGLRPNDFQANLEAAYALALDGKARDGAPFLRRARVLAPAEGESWVVQMKAWLELFPAYERWLDGDSAGAEAELVRLRRLVEGQGLLGRDPVSYPQGLGCFHLTLGQMSAAEGWFERLPDEVWRPLLLAHVAFVRGDRAALRSHASRVGRSARTSTLTIFQTRAGLLRQAEARIGDSPLGSAIASGELALARGQEAEAARLIREGLRQRSRAGTPPAFFLGSESLADLLERRGRLEQALAVLETAARERARTFGPPGPWGYFWIRTELRRATLLRKLGRGAEARRVEAGLMTLLARADPDHPVVVELRRRSS